MNKNYFRNFKPLMMNASGFTLVEVLVAVIIFSVVMLAGLAFFSYGMKPSARAQEVTYALTIAQNGIEGVRTTCTNQAAFNSFPMTTNETFPDPNSSITFTRTIRMAAGVFSRFLQVTVTWQPGNDAGALANSITLTTTVARPF